MLNQHVNHCIYGGGLIRALDGEYITVEFDNHIEKTFRYPDCFDGYMQFEDQKLQETALKAAKEKKEEQSRLREEGINAALTKINSLQAEQAKKKMQAAKMKDLITNYVGRDNYQEFMYVKKQLRKFGKISKIMSRDYIIEHPYIINSLDRIKCTETPEEILYFFRHAISDGTGDTDLYFEICSGLNPDGEFFSKAAKDRFIRTLAEFEVDHSDGYCGMEHEIFENAWNDLIAFCCQLLGSSYRRKKDYVSAFKYYKKESDIYGVATPWLGDLYLNGLGTERNIGKALACYFKEEFAPEQYTCNYPSDHLAPKPCPPERVFKAANSVADQMKGDRIFCYYFAKMLYEGFGTKVDLKRASEFALQSSLLKENSEWLDLEIGSDADHAARLLDEISSEEARVSCLDTKKSQELSMDVYKDLPKLKIKRVESNKGKERIHFQFYPHDYQSVDASYYPETSLFKTDWESKQFSLTDDALIVFQDALNTFDYRDAVEDAERCRIGFKESEFKLAEDKKYGTQICWRNTGEIADNQDSLNSGFIYQFYIKHGPEEFELQEGTLLDCNVICEVLGLGINYSIYARILFSAAQEVDRYLELGIKWAARVATDEELEEFGRIDGIKHNHFWVMR